MDDAIKARIKRDLPRRDGVSMKQSTLAGERDKKWFLIGLGATFMAGLFKSLFMERFGR